jgi:putative peptidoglycan lipid II flippase
LIALFAVAANVGLKIALFTPLGASGLALATAVGAWINFALLCALALKRDLMRLDKLFWKVSSAILVASLALLVVAIFGQSLAYELTKELGPWSGLAHLSLLGLSGLVIYACVALVSLRLMGVSLNHLRFTTSQSGSLQP